MMGMEILVRLGFFFLASVLVSIDSVLSLESVFFVVILLILVLPLMFADVDASPNVHWIY